MGQRSIRFPDELDALIVAAAQAEGRSFSNYVIRAVELDLSPGFQEARASVRAARTPVHGTVDLDAPENASIGSQAGPPTSPPNRADAFRRAAGGKKP